MIVYLFPNTSKPKSLQVMRDAGKILAEEGVQLLIDEQVETDGMRELGAAVLPREGAFARCDAVISVGGDGTMLHAARNAMLHDKPLLGINIGRLGFLTSVESDELDQLRRLPRGDYLLERRSVLQADVLGGDGPPLLALNDVVLYKECVGRAISLDIFCDDIMVSNFRGDGVIFATPTGSTAYSMSAGGPIVDAQLDSIVVTQICAHIVQTPPMVFAPSRVLRVLPRYAAMDEERVVIGCDGVLCQVLTPQQSVCIRQSNWHVPLIQFNDAVQLESIDKKLKGR